MHRVAEIVQDVFGEGGILSRELPGFQPRPGQQDMALRVATVLQDSGSLLAEAGTGIGKSLAYLIPSAYWSLTQDETIVVSTHTRALQEQLVQKDLPIVARVMEELVPRRPLKAVSLKGRANYLCRERWNAERAKRSPDPELASLIARMTSWVETSATGDKAELDLSERDDRLFHRLSASTENCSNALCRAKQGQKCFFARARTAAQRADLVIVNHALLFSDHGAGGVVLPQSSRLVIDEAHHLESVATRQFSFRLSVESIVRHIEAWIELRGSSAGGMFPATVGLLANAGAFAESAASSSEALGRIRSVIDDGDRAVRATRTLFDRLQVLEQEFSSGVSIGNSARIQASTRRLPLWSEVEIDADQLVTDLRQMESHCRWLIKSLTHAIESRQIGEPGESALAAVSAWIEEHSEFISQIEASFLTPVENGVYWIESLARGEGVAFNAAPLAVGEWIAASVFADKETIVCTSATLTVGNRFSHFRQQTGIEDADEFVAPSPFDYARSALIYVASDIAEPSHADYQREVDESIMRVSTALMGKTLALFTSNRHLRAAADALRGPLAARGIELFAQWVDAPPQELAERLREGGPVVVLGAASMWEGIDIPGPGLSALVVVRLPFDVPSDPLFQARSELYLSPFFEYAVPRSVLRFRQGFGRLIRSTTDRGVCVVLDRRIITKAYGRSFLDALPDCTVRRGTISEIGASVLDWVGEPVGDRNRQV